jgi:hypothetical protein
MNKKKLFSGLAFNAIMGAVLASAIGANPVGGAIVAIVVTALIGSFMPKGVLADGIATELWTGDIIRNLNAKVNGSFLQDIPDYSGKVDNQDVIHFVGEGGLPDVLINNTTYPIESQTITDSDIPISLDKYDTKVTPITDDELYAMSYDKRASLIQRHADAIAGAKFSKAIHALAPAATAAKTPVLFTSGDALTGARQPVTRDDFIDMKSKFDELEVPEEGRILVLCPDHVNDLLRTDQKFFGQFYNFETGQLSMNMYGFKCYSYVGCPVFDQTGAKLNYGTLPTTGSKYRASVAFYASRCFKAAGSTKMYYRDAITSPETHTSTMNFRHRYIVLPFVQEAIGAIVSKVKTA